MVLGAAFAMSIVGVCGACSSGCSPALNKKIVHTLIDVALAECIAENPDLDKISIMKVCRVADATLEPVIDELLKAQKLGAQKLATKRLSDAGTDAAH